MDNEELLYLIRKDRPGIIIHRVIGCTKVDFGIMMCRVDMEYDFFNIMVRHDGIIIPYPIKKYEKLSPEEKNCLKWLDIK